MKTITLSKLRILAVAVADAEEGSHEWDAATDALSAKFSPRQLVALIDKLQATQYERNEAFAELKRRDKASPVAWLIEGDSFPAHLSSNTEYAHQYPDRKVTPLYFEVPAAVLPPLIPLEGLAPDSRDPDDIRNYAQCIGYNLGIEAVRKLSCKHASEGGDE
ncbi:hypothetical protein [Pantoea coffeiphila]|uniref:Uncharacterized protein n=1 Tax=Pantoea coffeiphila TaxID=1465635 RepID=A0A2S9I894_9GAMM|nr:hypothetical protein [Pantoea coffeiphila]PRD14018.1 hypothetical protein CQW29_18620 [Pantoea coffeiphila]